MTETQNQEWQALVRAWDAGGSLPETEALRQNVEWLQLALDAAEIGAWDWDVRTGAVCWSGNLEAVHGFSPGAFDGTFEGYLNTIHPEDRERVQQALTEALAGRADYNVEFRTLRPDGTTHWTGARGKVLWDEAGQPVRMFGVCMDISERKRMQQAMKESEERFRALVENSSDAIAVISAEGILLYASPATHRILGYAKGEYIGKNPFALIHPEDVARISAAFARLVAQPGSKVSEQYRVQHQDGSWVWVEGVGTNLIHEPGIRGIVVNYRDITERKRLEEERRYIMASARCLLWWAEIEDHGHPDYLHWEMRLADPEAAQCFLPLDIQPGEDYLTAWYRCRLPEDRAACDRLGTASVRAGQSYQQEFRCCCVDGEIRWLHEDVHIEVVEAGRRWRAVGVATDITERKRREQEIQDLNARLRRAMAETHHRVKNNLQVIAALAEIQAAGARETVPVSALQRVGQHAGTLASIHDLLTHGAKTEGDAQSLSVKAALEKLLPMMETTLGSKRIRYQLDEVSLPVQKAAALALMVNELLSNAAKHGQGDIELTLTADGTEARLAVCDDGPGFPPDFDPSRAAHTGLEIVESVGRWDLQGQITYENRESGGACVSLRFPLPEGDSKPPSEGIS